MDKVFKTRRKGWHEQILFMYEGFLKEGVELPVIDMGAVRSLKDSRSYFDYDVLSKTTMYYAYGYEDYFEHLPKAIDILETGINCLKNVLDPLENKCDIRFDSLKKSLPILFKKYEVKHAD